MCAHGVDRKLFLLVLWLIGIKVGPTRLTSLCWSHTLIFSALCQECGDCLGTKVFEFSSASLALYLVPGFSFSLQSYGNNLNRKQQKKSQRCMASVLPQASYSVSCHGSPGVPDALSDKLLGGGFDEY